MAYAVNLYLDSGTTLHIQRIWDTLTSRNLTLSMRVAADRPHLTLAIYDELNVPAAQLALVRFVQELTVIPIRMPALGVFPGEHGSVYLAVTVTEPLLAMHTRLHRELDRFGHGPWSIYRPGNWVPHCTLAMNVPPETLPRAVAAATESWKPLDGVLEEIGISQFEPLSHMYRLPLPRTSRPAPASQAPPQPARAVEILRAWRSVRKFG